LADAVLQIKLFIVVAFRTRAVSTNRRNVEHAASKLKERSTLWQHKKTKRVRLTYD
jgi:hypothetical protein